jgi:hypothetical protein
MGSAVGVAGKGRWSTILDAKGNRHFASLDCWHSSLLDPDLPASNLRLMSRCGRLRRADLNGVGDEFPLVGFLSMNHNPVADLQFSGLYRYIGFRKCGIRRGRDFDAFVSGRLNDDRVL